MSKDNSVPKLDLAPKLKRPLSLRNPLDYLRLLYWVFYFPQALRWYLDTFGGGYIPDTEMSARKGWQILGQNSVQRNLLLQGVILTVIIPPLLCQFLEQIGIEVDWFGVAGGVALGVASSVAGGVATIRPENWLISTPVNSLSIQNKNRLFPRVTLLPLPKLNICFQNWLIKDWETGLYNLNQVLQYSLQFIPVMSAVNQVLAKIPTEQIIFRVTQLAQNPYDWNLLRFASASIEAELKSNFMETLVNFPLFFFIPKNCKQRVKDKFIADIRLDTSARSTAAGFWYLHEKKTRQGNRSFCRRA